MPTSSIEYDRNGAVVRLTIVNPAQRNALSDGVLAELVRRLQEADADAEVRAIIIAGSDEVFASGADVRSLLTRSALEIYAGDRALLWEATRRIRTPLVAAVSGLCLGAGCELAMISDIVVASDTARFGLPETQLGLIPGAGGTQLLPRAIGKATAMDMVLTGRLLSADEALSAGLVSRVVGVDAWLATADKIGRRIASRPAVAQRLAKEAINAAFETPLRAGIDGERRAFAMAFASDDAREGMTAFVDKRDPTWQHR